jgi:hypothetical protein
MLRCSVLIRGRGGREEEEEDEEDAAGGWACVSLPAVEIDYILLCNDNEKKRRRRKRRRVMKKTNTKLQTNPNSQARRV